MKMTVALLALAGAGSLFRGLYRARRAVVGIGKVQRCSGKSQYGVCDVTDVIAAPSGTKVFAVAPGKIAAVGGHFVHLVADNEPIIVMYEGVQPSVAEGDEVGIGEQIGVSTGPVSFGVTQMIPAQAVGNYALRPVVPSAWLAARGMRHADVQMGGQQLWCEGGRRQVAPPATVQCEFAAPELPSFALLPVQIDLTAR
jgi:hypothetical protein